MHALFHMPSIQAVHLRTSFTLRDMPDGQPHLLKRAFEGLFHTGIKHEVEANGQIKAGAHNQQAELQARKWKWVTHRD
jgi:hypothetical protein